MQTEVIADDELKSSIFILQFPTILECMSWIVVIMTHNSSRGFCVSYRSRSNSNKPLKIQKILEK